MADSQVSVQPETRINQVINSRNKRTEDKLLERLIAGVEDNHQRAEEAQPQQSRPGKTTDCDGLPLLPTSGLMVLTSLHKII